MSESKEDPLESLLAIGTTWYYLDNDDLEYYPIYIIRVSPTHVTYAHVHGNFTTPIDNFLHLFRRKL